MKIGSIARRLPVLLVFAVLACADSGTGPDPTPDPGPLPLDVSIEALEIAVYYSGELQAPAPLAIQVEEELQLIRAGFSGQYPALNSVRFRLPWMPSCFIVGLTPEAAGQVLAGQYHAWDELNARYGLTQMNTELLQSLDAVVLHFEGIQHSRRLIDAYAGLMGFQYIEPNGIAGDGPIVYPGFTPAGSTYLFRDAWGDCPCGCTGETFWYFVFENGLPRLAGSGVPWGEPLPAWWLEARGNIELYQRLSGADGAPAGT